MKNLFKLYKIGWTNEGILWRKGDFCILKPTRPADSCHPSSLFCFRKVGGESGKQLLEYEENFMNEKEAFEWGNHVVRNLKRHEKVNKKKNK